VFVIEVAALGLLLIGMRNAWDTVTHSLCAAVDFPLARERGVLL
jgi:hypothetical protein